MELNGILKGIGPEDAEARAEASRRWNSLAKPLGGLGLLETALDGGRTELAVRIGYWGQDGAVKVESAMSQLREERGLTEEQAWVVRYYPASGPVGLIEFLMDPDAEDLEEAAFAELPASEAEGDSGETPQELSEKNE